MKKRKKQTIINVLFFREIETINITEKPISNQKNINIKN